MPKVLPYCYPTTVVFVDDDKAFLQNLVIGLDDDLASVIFESPIAALAYIEAAANVRGHEVVLAAHREIPDGVDRALADRMITVELSKIPQLVYDPKRFEELSVVVVDYAMPGLSGLEFCERLADLPIRKILLTGKADEKTAVQAFNAGIIDRFIVKNDPNALGLVGENAKALQARQFELNAEVIVRALGGQAPGFLRDPKFAELFAEVRQRCRAVEYYLAADASGMLLVDGEGRPTLCTALTAQDLRAHWEIARDQDAPAELLAALEARTVVPYFWQSEGFYDPGCADWRACLHPAETFEGAETYYYALIAAPPNVDPARIYPYERYLEALDAGRDA